MPIRTSESVKFRPTYGLEDKILESPIAEGHLYFATDTGRVYLDTYLGERLAVGGGGVAVLYTNATDIEYLVNNTYNINKNDLLDKSYIPRANDLIINSDGRFFKVKTFLSDTGIINCTLIAVSGTGGGGGGPSVGPSTDPKIIDVEYHDFKATFVKGYNYTIDLTAKSKKDKSMQLKYSVYVGDGTTSSKLVGEGSLEIDDGVRVSLPVGQYIEADAGTYAVLIQISGANTSAPDKWFTNIHCFEMFVETDSSYQKAKKYTGIVPYSLYVKGNLTKNLFAVIDNDFSAFGERNFETISPSLDKEKRIINIDCEALHLKSGIHTITVWAEAQGIKSNIETVDFIYHNPEDEDATYVIITEAPERCLSYETPAVKYWVCNTAQTSGTNNVVISVNGRRVENQPEPPQQQEGVELIQFLTKLEANKTNICTITANNSGSRSVQIYCEYSNIFDPYKEGDVLLLNSDGRTNDTSKELRENWKYVNSKKQTITPIFQDFNWLNDGNGWIMDLDERYPIEENKQRTRLRITNGASLAIPLDLFSNPVYGASDGYTLEFEFKPYNLQSYKLLTSSTKTTVDDSGTDEIVTIERSFDTESAIISYIDSTNNLNKFGFCCGTQDVFFSMSNGDHCTARYVDNQVLDIALTINTKEQQLILYVNGIMSGMTSYLSTAKLPVAASQILFNSNLCDIDLFNVRVYDTCLSSGDVVKNYIANQRNLQLYTENNLVSNNTLSLKDLKDYNLKNSANQTIPYIIFKTKRAPNVLPFNKSNDDILCDITFVNPAADQKLDREEITVDEYLKQAPSFLATDVSLNVQGTSSQRYPRKNFKGKFKNATNWTCLNTKVDSAKRTLTKFYINPSISERTFTWKVDYMDSSSCHNTGFVNFAYTLYNKHPLDYVINPEKNEYHQQYRTTLYGFPVLAFHETSDGKTEFIGIYNFNLDKSAPKILGMENDTIHPHVTGTYITDKGEEKPLDFTHVCECWEMANNQGGRCSFKTPDFDSGVVYYDENDNLIEQPGYFYLNEETGETVEGTSDLGEDIEVRYHWNKDAIEGAWENANEPLEDGGVLLPNRSRDAFQILLGGYRDKEGNIHNRTGAYKNLERFFIWLQNCFYAFDLNNEDDQKWIKELLNRPETSENVQANDIEYQNLIATRKNIFETQFDKHLNKEYCFVYYILTELLLQFDSRGKNMMFASWGPTANSDGEYVWFPLYYDVDTQLGVNNSGIPSWEYNVEPTTGFNNKFEKAFSTATSLLWGNIYESFVKNPTTDFLQKYRSLRGSSLRLENLLSYFNFEPRITGDYCMLGTLPINVFNASQYYKYILPGMRTPSGGYVSGVDKLNNPEKSYSSSYYYCLQGTRQLYREQILERRLNYYDSKWLAQDYQIGEGGKELYWRVMGKGEEYYTNMFPSLTEEEKIKNSKEIYTDSKLSITPVLDQYIVAYYDESTPTPIFAEGGKAVEIQMKPLKSSGQILHLAGGQYYKELGNMSKWYPEELAYSPISTAIELGNSNPYYRPNDNFSLSHFNDIFNEEKPLVKLIDITNIPQINTISLLSSVKLEEFKALGTSITTADFAAGVNLKKVYLPETLQEISFKEAKNLKKIIYNQDELFDGDNEVNALYIHNLISQKDERDYTNINSIDIIGGGLGQFSYDLLKKLTNTKQAMYNKPGENSNLKINLEKVNWSPYVKLGEGAEKRDDYLYYYSTDNFTFEDYTYVDNNKWNKDISEERLYYLDTSLSDITFASDLSLFNIYKEDILQNRRQFTSDKQANGYPNITGDIYLNNEIPLSEKDLDEIHRKYFPNLQIKAKNVTEAYRIKFIYELKGREYEIDTLRFLNKTPSSDEIIIPNFIPPEHYQFNHWEDVNGNVIDINDIKALNFNEVNEYIIKANIELIKYSVQFYVEEYSEATKTWTYVTKEEWSVETTAENNSIIEPLFPYKDESQLKINECYKFLGYALSENSNSYVDLNNISITENNTPLYAKFEIEDVYDNPVNLKYLTITDGYISQNPNEKNIKGKITIPRSINNIVIQGIDKKGFYNNTEITHIFWSKDNVSTTIKDEAFKECTSLKYFEISDHLTEIGIGAFEGVRGLRLYHAGIVNNSLVNTPSETDFRIAGESLTTIKANAFREAFVNSLNSGDKIIIGGKISTVGDYAFGYNFGDKHILISFGDLNRNDYWSNSLLNSFSSKAFGHYSYSQYTLGITVCANAPTYTTDDFRIKYFNGPSADRIIVNIQTAAIAS